MLSNCMILDAFLMTKYDPNEYKLITDIRHQAHSSKEQCSSADTSKSNAAAIAKTIELFVMYSEHIPRNRDVIRASTELHDMAKELTERYQKSAVSTVFCKLKFDNIESSAVKMQHLIGSRPR